MLWWLCAAGISMAVAAVPAPAAKEGGVHAVVIVSANAEWRVVRAELSTATVARSPHGEFIEKRIAGRRVVILHGGWGKVDAAASAQYAIDRWRPAAILNLGTCGGMAGVIARHDIVLASRTVIYDIVERMGDSAEAIRDYTTAIDLSWLGSSPLPLPVRQAVLVSGDRDLDPNDVASLGKLYGAVAADWESGAIARVAARNGIKRLLILRGVSDLVGTKAGSGEAYGKPGVFEQGTAVVMKNLLGSLPDWIALTAK